MVWVSMDNEITKQDRAIIQMTFNTIFIEDCCPPIISGIFERPRVEKMT